MRHLFIDITKAHRNVFQLGFTAHATSKVGLTGTIAVELGYRARFVVIEPAAIGTPMLWAGLNGVRESFAHLDDCTRPIGSKGRRKAVGSDASGIMRQVNRDELIWQLAAAMRHVPASVRKALADMRPGPRKQAEDCIGTVMADRTARYEVLSSVPRVAETLFSQQLANIRGLDTEAARRSLTGAPEAVFDD